MGRWRPPRPRSSPYITPAGKLQLEDELSSLWVRRRDVVAALSAAAAEGDRSENAEYIYRKKELAGIDSRIRYLQKRIPDLEVVDMKPAGDRVFFGAWVDLEREDGEQVEYRIVGADEADAGENRISVDSPMARALIGKSLDDEVEVKTADAQTTWYVCGIRYD